MNVNERLGISTDPSTGFESYVDIQDDRCYLDGYFTAEDLRRIAAEMDRLAKEKNPAPQSVA